MLLTIARYTIFGLIVFSIILFYLIFTPLGHQNLYHTLSYIVSQKSDLNVTVKSVNILHYPHITAEMNINKKAKFNLDGYFSLDKINMIYTLSSQCISSEMCKIDDDIDIGGTIQGKYGQLKIEGEGKALDGYVVYSAIKFPDKVEDINLSMREVNSSKLFTLSGQKNLIKGKANVDIFFSLMEEKYRRGVITYTVQDNNFSGIPLNLSTTITIDGSQQTFVSQVSSPYLQLDVVEGKYNQEEKKATANYTLEVNDLSRLEAILGYKYLGTLSLRGKLSYDKYLKISGFSKTFGGKTSFVFQKDTLKIFFKKSSFSHLMKLFDSPLPIEAQTKGELSYHFITKILLVNSELKDATFLPSRMVDILYQKSGVDLLKEEFDNSTLNLRYYNDVFQGTFKIANAQSHLYLSNIKVDTHYDNINAYFDLDMQRQAFSGKIYGTLDNPKLNLNMQKLVQYQMEKQLDAMVGKGSRKIMESMPMGGVAKEVTTEVAASFMGMFF